AVASDYFKAMFRCGLKESTSATVPLTMEMEILTSIVDYMYTGEIELTADNVESLVKACDLLQQDTLKDACENFMLKQVQPANCVGFYKFATLYRLDQLQKKARRVILSEFKTVAFMKEFKELSCTELIEFIKDDDVNVEYEDIVNEAVLDWVRHDLDNR
ncbi:Kelch-like protein 38, partial [Lamellibrachia satsuma]